MRSKIILKKLGLLFSLFLLFSLSLSLSLKAIDIQQTCQEQREKVSDMINVISTIQDTSIKNWLYQECINPIQEKINKQQTNGHIVDFLGFDVYYFQGFVLAYKQLDEKIQAYRKAYNKMRKWGKDLDINPHKPAFINIEDQWYQSIENLTLFSVYFIPTSVKYLPIISYTIAKFHTYLQEYVDCIPIIKGDKKLELSAKTNQFFDDHKLWNYPPQDLADLIIQLSIESEKISNLLVDIHDNILCRCVSNDIIFQGISKDISWDDAFDDIKKAVGALSPRQYDDVIKALRLECERQELTDRPISLLAHQKLESIEKFYAKKLIEKAKSTCKP